MWLTAIRMLASASKTDVPFLPSEVFAQVPARYWKTPDAELLGFLEFASSPDSHEAMRVRRPESKPKVAAWMVMRSATSSGV